jgi:hypothetical protein
MADVTLHTPSPTPAIEPIGDRIRRCRQVRGGTQDELAQRAGLNRSMLTLIERASAGRRCRSILPGALPGRSALAWICSSACQSCEGRLWQALALGISRGGMGDSAGRVQRCPRLSQHSHSQRRSHTP